MKTNKQKTIIFLRAVYRAAEMGGSRFKPDMFADRLQRAAAETTLEKLCETLLKICNPDGSRLNNIAIIEMLGVCGSEEAPGLLAWLRSSSRLAAAMACSQADSELLEAACAAIQLPSVAGEADHAAARGSFDIRLAMTLHAPLALGVELLRQRGFLGAENRRGFGKVEITAEGAASPDEYLEHLASRKDEILNYLAEIGALPKP